MNDLTVFQAPNDGELTLCDIDGRIFSSEFQYANVSNFTHVTDTHPNIHITQNVLHSKGSGEEARDLFLPVEDEPWLKRLIQMYYEHGFVDAVHEASLNGPFVVKQSATMALYIINLFGIVQSKLNSYSHESSGVIMEALSQTRSWSHNPIRCIAWHCYSTKIAVAASDDSVRIYCAGTTHVPILKNKRQQNITCMEWRPLSNSDLAVGCETGIFVWSIDNKSLQTRHSMNNATILHRVDHKPVVSVSWSLRGDLLASAAACDSKILIWNVELDETSSLKRPGGSGNVLVKWSPNGNKLFTATNSVIFRVWECQTWQVERWSILAGRIQAAAWSACDLHLIFTTTEDSFLYSLPFKQADLPFLSSSKTSPNQAIPVYDFTKVDVEGVIVGGIVRSMDWDCTGHHLAILFQDTDYVALFKVALVPILQLSPSCLVAGKPEEKPTAIEFQKNFEHGACLSICWSSGRLQHFPIISGENLTPNLSVSRSAANSTFLDAQSGLERSNLSFY